MLRATIKLCELLNKAKNGAFFALYLNFYVSHNIIKARPVDIPFEEAANHKKNAASVVKFALSQQQQVTCLTNPTRLAIQ